MYLVNNIEVDTKADLVLLLLKDGSVIGITRMQKLIFLMIKEGGFGKLVKGNSDPFKYEAWRMGPFSSELFDEIEMLEGMSLVNVEPCNQKISEDVLEERKIIDAFSNRNADITDSEANKRFSLSEKGEIISNKLFDTLESKYRNYLEKKTWNYYKHIPLFDLLNYVYKNYEGYTHNSEIKNNLKR